MPVLNHGDTESSIRREVVDEVPEKSSSPPPTAAPEAPWEIQGHADTESLLGASDLLFGQGQSVMSGNFQDLTRNGPNQTEDGSSVHVIQDLMASTAAQSAGQVAMTNGGHALQDSSSLPEQTIARHVMPPSAMDHIPQDDDYRETGLTRLNLQNRQPRSSNMKKVSGSSSRSVDSDTSEGSMDTNLER
ncbi:hypothetical protein IMZ48_45805 [Candidatus Bathyarchaeota archaeon]|nr:hypothetical protein [Candidatus Bathyarchaeota archaeon]